MTLAFVRLRAILQMHVHLPALFTLNYCELNTCCSIIAKKEKEIMYKLYSIILINSHRS